MVLIDIFFSLKASIEICVPIKYYFNTNYSLIQNYNKNSKQANNSKSNFKILIFLLSCNIMINGNIKDFN